MLHDERAENEIPYPSQSEPCFYYRFQNGHPVVNTIVQEDADNALTLKESHVKHSTISAAPRKERKLARETVNLEVSILAQRRDPELYPEITHLADGNEAAAKGRTGRVARQVSAGPVVD